MNKPNNGQLINSYKKAIVPAIIGWLSEQLGRVFVTFNTEHKDAMVPVYVIENAARHEGIFVCKEGEDTATISSVKKKILTLNISVDAVGRLEMLEDGISAQMRFSGKVEDIFIPYEAILVVNSPDFANSVKDKDFAPIAISQQAMDSSHRFISSLNELDNDANQIQERPRPKLTVVK